MVAHAATDSYCSSILSFGRSMHSTTDRGALAEPRLYGLVMIWYFDAAWQPMTSLRPLAMTAALCQMRLLRADAVGVMPCRRDERPDSLRLLLCVAAGQWNWRVEREWHFSAFTADGSDAKRR